MSSLDMNKEELVQYITRMVLEALRGGPTIPIGISNRHIHLDRADMDILFGVGSELTNIRNVKQPGQFACAETVAIRGPKGQIDKVRILGPLRAESQIEVSVSDGYKLGVSPPVRESGNLEDTPGVEIIGPCGQVKKERGAIVAYRHIHMSPEDAIRFAVKDRDVVSVKAGDEVRGSILNNVIVRVSDKFVLEMHLDIEEANAIGIKNDDLAVICK